MVKRANMDMVKREGGRRSSRGRGRGGGRGGGNGRGRGGGRGGGRTAIVGGGGGEAPLMEVLLADLVVKSLSPDTPPPPNTPAFVDLIDIACQRFDSAWQKSEFTAAYKPVPAATSAPPPLDRDGLRLNVALSVLPSTMTIKFEQPPSGATIDTPALQRLFVAFASMVICAHAVALLLGLPDVGETEPLYFDDPSAALAYWMLATRGCTPVPSAILGTACLELERIEHLCAVLPDEQRSQVVSILKVLIDAARAP